MFLPLMASDQLCHLLASFNVISIHFVYYISLTLLNNSVCMFLDNGYMYSIAKESIKIIFHHDE